MSKKHKIVMIGWMGDKTAYLDISREEAIEKYMKTEGIKSIENLPPISEFEFDDSFNVYTAWVNN